MYSAVCTCIVLIALQCAHVYYTCIVLSAVCTCIVSIASLSGKVWKFRSSKRHCSALESGGMLHSFYAGVQCVLPQSDVQERCIVYRVVHGAQYAGVCPLVQEWCTVCTRVHCLAGAAEEECGMHWLAGAGRASLWCAGGCRWGAVHARPHCGVKECGLQEQRRAQCRVQEFGHRSLQEG